MPEKRSGTHSSGAQQDEADGTRGSRTARVERWSSSEQGTTTGLLKGKPDRHSTSSELIFAPFVSCPPPSHTIDSLPLGRNTEFIALLQDNIDFADGGRVSQIVSVSGEDGNGNSCLDNLPHYLDFVRLCLERRRSRSSSSRLRTDWLPLADFRGRPYPSQRLRDSDLDLAEQRNVSYRYHGRVICRFD